MPRFLIVEPGTLNGQRGGRGARGRNLEVFLKLYYGSSSVSTVSVERLSSKASFSVDHLFVGIPSTISSKELERVTYKKLHLFDYRDNEKAIWGDTDESLLRSKTNSYLKAWTQKDWDEGFEWGTLPIRRNSSLPYYLKFCRLTKGRSYISRERSIDTTFLGNPVVIWKENYGSKMVNARIQWLEEIVSKGQFTFSGGFFMHGSVTEELKAASSASLQPLFLNKGRINFASYFNLMLNAKTALAPPGNALWSYRHYEAIYAGAIPLSSDFRDAEMLVPLPNEGIVHVPKGESVIPHLGGALRLKKDIPELPARNLEFVEQFMKDGAYHRTRIKLLERFMSQLGNA
jgi:hypothetical protein